MKWQFTLDNSIEGSLVLNDEPIGWAGVVFNLKRDLQWHGIFFEYAINLQFYGEGFDYIKNIYDTQGVDAQITISIEMKCSDTDDFTSFFEGKLVVPKCLFDCKDDCIVSVPIEQAGCLMNFKNRIDQPVDLNANEDFDGNALPVYGKLPFNITLLPRGIVLKVLTDMCDLMAGGTIVSFPAIHDSPTHTISPDITGGCQDVNEYSYSNIPIGCQILNELSVSIPQSLQWDDSLGAIAPIFVAPFTGTYDFSLIVIVNVRVDTASSDGNASLFVQLIKNGSVIVNIPVSGSVSGGYTYFTINNTLTYSGYLNISDVFQAVIRYQVDGCFERDHVNPYDIHFEYFLAYDNNFFSKLTINSLVEAPDSMCPVYMVNEALSRVVESITNDCMRVKSNYFGRTDSEPYTSGSNGCGSMEVITKGLLIRQFQSSMPISFKDLFEGLNAIHNIGIGTEPDKVRADGSDWLRVEPMEYFYNNDIIFIADNVPEIKKTVKPEWYVSVIDFGYSKWEAEFSMGLDEICTKRSYRSTLKEVQKNATQICKFIASGYAIEVTRNIEFSLDSTKDWRYDNDIFIICVKKVGAAYSNEQGQDCADMGTITDILHPESVYNYRISPVRDFLRWIKAYMADYFFDTADASAKFIFTKGEGNFIESGVLTTGCIMESSEIAENAIINKSSFADSDQAQPIYKFETDEFDYPLSNDELADIKANPQGLIQYRNRSTDPWSYGYINNIQHKPNDGEATFLLLPKYRPL